MATGAMGDLESSQEPHRAARFLWASRTGRNVWREYPTEK
jgi:hypothetical protein